MTALYVPPTDESDHKKQNQSIQNIAAQTSTNTTNISTNTTNIATNTTNIATNTANIATLQTPNYGLVNSGGALGVSISTITAALGADVALNNTANYFDGPSVTQGSTGIWFVSGSVTVVDTAAISAFRVKLWDGTTVISSTQIQVQAAGVPSTIALSGYLASPASNLKISVKDVSAATGKILFNQSGESKDSTISAFRIA